MNEKKKKKLRAKKVIRSSSAGKVMDGDMVSMKEAMKITGFAMGSIYRLMHKGDLDVYKRGRATFFKRVDIERIMTPVRVEFSKLIKRGKEAAGQSKKTPPKVSKDGKRKSSASSTHAKAKAKKSTRAKSASRSSKSRAPKRVVQKALDAMAPAPSAEVTS